MTHNHRTRGQAAPKRITKKIKIKKKTKNKKSNIHVTWFYRNWVPVPTPIKKSRCTGGTLSTHTPHTKAQFPTAHVRAHPRSSPLPAEFRTRRSARHFLWAGPKEKFKKKKKRSTQNHKQQYTKTRAQKTPSR